MTLVGIVVPARNAGRFLDATLASIQAQSLSDWQCAVVDDGSKDDTRAIAEQFAARDPRFTVLAQDPAGPCRARNRGLTALVNQAEFLTFMDADDVWLPNTLAVLVEAARQNSAAIGAHGLGEFIDEAGERFLPGHFASLGRSRLGCEGGWPRTWDPSRPTEFESVVTQSVVFPPGVMVVRSSAYAAVGLFDDAMRFAEDWDMLIRLVRLGHLEFVDDVVLLYRRHDTNLGTSAEVPEAVARVRTKAFYSPENSPEQRRIVRDAWRASQVINGKRRMSDAREMWSPRHWIRSIAQLGRLPFLVTRYARGRPPRSSARPQSEKPSPVRILYVTKTPPSSSGIARYAVNFADALRELGDVHTLSAGHEARESRRMSRMFTLSWRGMRTVQRDRPDLVVVDISGGCIAEAVTALLLTIRRSGSAIVLTVHDPPVLTGGLFLFLALDRRGGRRVSQWLSRTLGRRLERVLLERADLVMALSAIGARELCSNYGLERSVQTVPHVAKIHGGLQEGAVVFFVAPLREDTVVPGLRTLAEHPECVRGVLLGNGSEPAPEGIVAAIADMGLESMASITGLLDQRGLDDAYGASAIVIRVLPADDPRWNYANTAAVSGPVFDALGAGAVMITNAARSASEYVTDGVDAFLLDEGDVRYEHLLARLLEEPGLLDRMRSAATRSAVASLSPSAVAASLARPFASLCSSAESDRTRRE